MYMLHNYMMLHSLILLSNINWRLIPAAAKVYDMHNHVAEFSYHVKNNYQDLHHVCMWISHATVQKQQLVIIYTLWQLDKICFVV